MHEYLQKKKGVNMRTIAPISQRDNRWKNVILGDENAPKNSTIGSVGCLLTSLTMLIKYYYYDDLIRIPNMPKILNEMLKEVNGYYKGNLIIHKKITELFPRIKFHGSVSCNDFPAPIPLIDMMLPIPVKVDFNVKTGAVDGHWILATDKITMDGKTIDYVINDPWTGEKNTLLRKYGKKNWNIARAIFGVLKYSGKGKIKQKKKHGNCAFQSNGKCYNKNSKAKYVNAIETGCGFWQSFMNWCDFDKFDTLEEDIDWQKWNKKERKLK